MLPKLFRIDFATFAHKEIEEDIVQQKHTHPVTLLRK